MPELPEVETVVRDIRKKVLGHRITAVWFDWPKMLKDHAKQSRLVVSKPALARFASDLVGEKIIDAKRRAKNILIYLTHDKVLLMHLKMSGRILIGKKITDNFIHLILTLDDGRMVALSDVRKFAKAILGSRAQIENLEGLQKLGPDALDPTLSLKKFNQVIAGEGRTIKQVLMDPGVIAGIGNIYSDDILWQATVHPKRSPKSLSRGELAAIYKAMRRVLAKAVKLRGTSTSDFRDTSGKEGGYTGYRLVYQRTGKPCNRCKTLIQRLVIGGRSAHFCPECQKI